jgi:hypothetical protein
MATENKKLQAILLDLNSGDDARKINAVRELKVHGDESAILPILNILKDAPADELRREIIETLNSLKLSSAPKAMIGALFNPDYRKLRPVILTSIWNSGLDYSDFVPEIVQAATEGDLVEVLECITIIENLDGDLLEAPFLEGQLIVKEYLSQNKSETSQRMDLLRELDALLQLRIDNS